MRKIGGRNSLLLMQDLVLKVGGLDEEVPCNAFQNAIISRSVGMNGETDGRLFEVHAHVMKFLEFLVF